MAGGTSHFYSFFFVNIWQDLIFWYDNIGLWLGKLSLKLIICTIQLGQGQLMTPMFLRQCHDVSLCQVSSQDLSLSLTNGARCIGCTSILVLFTRAWKVGQGHQMEISIVKTMLCCMLVMKFTTRSLTFTTSGCIIVDYGAGLPIHRSQVCDPSLFLSFGFKPRSCLCMTNVLMGC